MRRVLSINEVSIEKAVRVLFFINDRNGPTSQIVTVKKVSPEQKSCYFSKP